MGPQCNQSTTLQIRSIGSHAKGRQRLGAWFPTVLSDSIASIPMATIDRESVMCQTENLHIS